MHERRKRLESAIAVFGQRPRKRFGRLVGAGLPHAIAVERRQEAHRLVGDERERLLRLVLQQEWIGHEAHPTRRPRLQSFLQRGEREQYANRARREPPGGARRGVASAELARERTPRTDRLGEYGNARYSVLEWSNGPVAQWER